MIITNAALTTSPLIIVDAATAQDARPLKNNPADQDPSVCRRPSASVRLMRLVSFLAFALFLPRHYKWDNLV